MADESLVWEPWENGPGCYSDAPCGLRLTVRWSHEGKFWMWGVGDLRGRLLACGNSYSPSEAKKLATEAYRRWRNG